jgi:hypothetical protein
MAAAAPWIDESILLKVIPLTKLAAYEWNITTNVMVYNEAFFNIFGLDKNSEKAKDDLLKLTYVVDKEKIIRETERVVNYARSIDLTRDGKRNTKLFFNSLLFRKIFCLFAFMNLGE